MQISWIARGLRTGVLTTRYPTVHEPLPAGFRGRLRLAPGRCQAARGCDDCVRACLPRALTLEVAPDGGARRLRLNLGTCIGCGLCVETCPSGALAFDSEYELAVRDPADLWTEVAFDDGSADHELEHGGAERGENGHRG